MANVQMSEPFTFGIEEEFFLVDAQTKSAVRRMPPDFMAAAKAAIGTAVSTEFLQSQVEVMTPPHADMQDALRELRNLRRTVAEVAGRFGMTILAAGTHPTAQWERSQQSEGERYDAVMDDLQMIGLRNMLCGLHIHVELPDPGQRIDVMSRMLPYLPLFVALSASSPFWRSRKTGLKAYRLAAYDELPRTGIPEMFRTQAEFDAYIEALVRADVIEDSSYIWWAIRPSRAHPTLELRAPDCCTNVEHAIALAALYRGLVRRLSRDPFKNAEHDIVSRAIIQENKWRAQRYGIAGTFADLSGKGPVSVENMLRDVLYDIRDDLDALGCAREAMSCREIFRSGTSADRQIEIFETNGGVNDPARALAAVSNWIASESVPQQESCYA
jgi:carboxylate-amine ligase